MPDLSEKICQKCKRKEATTWDVSFGYLCEDCDKEEKPERDFWRYITG